MNTIEIYVTTKYVKLTADVKGQTLTKKLTTMKEYQDYEAKQVLQQLEKGFSQLKSLNYKVIVTFDGRLSRLDSLALQFKWLRAQSYKNFTKKDGLDIFLADYWRAVFSNPIAKALLQKHMIEFNYTYESDPNFAGD